VNERDQFQTGIGHEYAYAMRSCEADEPRLGEPSSSRSAKCPNPGFVALELDVQVGRHFLPLVARRSTFEDDGRRSSMNLPMTNALSLL